MAIIRRYRRPLAVGLVASRRQVTRAYIYFHLVWVVAAMQTGGSMSKNWKVNHITSQRAGDKITKTERATWEKTRHAHGSAIYSIAIDKMVWDKATQQDMISLLFPFFFAVVVTVELLVSRLQNDKFPEEKVAPAIKLLTIKHIFLYCDGKQMNNMFAET